IFLLKIMIRNVDNIPNFKDYNQCNIITSHQGVDMYYEIRFPQVTIKHLSPIEYTGVKVG
ncbi:TPA: hypothetical protein ACH7F5_005069, partial [Escherichia coli]